MNVHHRLAWHETLDMHELVAFQTVSLIELKRAIRQVQDQELRNLYAQTIQVLDGNLRELLAFYPNAPIPPGHRDQKDPATGFFAGNLLGMAKTLVRSYAIAITETATPSLREVLTRQINVAIRLHASVYYFMYERSYYPSYDLEKLLANDVRNAQTALSM
ncbi:spore coat protein [Paenibacillus flagellatus]|uniref:Spore coat protein n=1 Tax=Paenibacillus flagellatus TaxID=2211139 RepID=A0A2V5KJX7_9BACL|nr:spore coat protein [Paenibacillus flagellatus]PYI50787.1 spore coat protein [Paenibacillus flagellatus]